MSRQAPDLDHFTDTHAEPVPDPIDPHDQNPDPAEDRRARYGGTDLFRGVLVVLLALAVGGYLLTRSLEAPSGDDTVTADDETAVANDDLDGATDEDLVPAAPDESEAAAADNSTADGTAGADSADQAAADQGGDNLASDEDSNAGDTTDDTTTTGPAIRPPNEVTVQVLNATDRKGIAGQGTDLLSLAGYATVPAGNALEAQPSAILYTEGFEDEALAVATILGTGLESLVQPLDPSLILSEDPVAADVVVVLGNDDAIPI